jgi:hypothetical protein
MGSVSAGGYEFAITGLELRDGRLVITASGPTVQEMHVAGREVTIYGRDGWGFACASEAEADGLGHVRVVIPLARAEQRSGTAPARCAQD